MGAGGAAVGAVTLLAGLFTGGIGAVQYWVLAAAAMSAGVAGYAYVLGTGFKNMKRAFRELATQTRKIQDSAMSMQLIVFTINNSLKEIGTNVKNIRHYKTQYTTILVDALKQLFDNMSGKDLM